MSDEVLRRLERAAVTDGGAAWSPYAFALARTGKTSSAQAAAFRALAHDPRDPARDLLEPAPVGLPLPGIGLGGSVAWPGLAGLGNWRTVKLPMKVGPELTDLGHGVVGLRVSPRRGHEVCAVDLFTADIVWRRMQKAPSLFVAGRRVFEGGLEGEFRALDPRTGGPVGPELEIPGVRAMRDEDRRTQAIFYFEGTCVSLDEDLIAGVIDAEFATSRRRRPRRLVILDASSGAVRADVDLPASARDRVAHHERGLVIELDRERLLAYDAMGGRRWTSRIAGSLIGVADGRVFVASRSYTRIRVLDLETGKKLHELAVPGAARSGTLLMTERALVHDHGDLLAFDRATLRPLWQQPLTAQTRAYATEDAVITVEAPVVGRNSTARDAWTVGTIASLDPATGERLAALDARGMALPDRIGLLAGRLILLTRDGHLHLLEPPELAPREHARRVTGTRDAPRGRSPRSGASRSRGGRASG